MWHAHLARDFTGGTPVPLAKTGHYLNVCLLRPRIHLHDERLRVALAPRSELHRVRSGQRGGNTATTEAAATSSATSGRSLRWRRTKVPNPSMHARRGRQRFRRAHPERGNVERVGIYTCRLVFAGITTNHIARWIENLKRDRTVCVGLQIVINKSAVGRIFGKRLVAWHGRAVVTAGCHVEGIRGPKQ